MNHGYVRQALDIDPGKLRLKGDPHGSSVEGGLVPKVLVGCHGLTGSDQQDGEVPSKHLKSCQL